MAERTVAVGASAVLEDSEQVLIAGLVRALESLDVPALVVERRPHEGLLRAVTDAFVRATRCGGKAVVGRQIDALEGAFASSDARERLTSALRGGHATHLSIRNGGDPVAGPAGRLLLTPLAASGNRASSVLGIWLEDPDPIGAGWLTPREVQRIAVSKAEWESTVDSLAELVVLVDSEMRVIRVNRTVEEWSLGAVQTAKGRDLHELLHGACSRADCPLIALWRQLGRDRDPLQAVEFTGNDDDLRRRVHVTMYAVPSRQGIDEAVTVVVRDVSRSHEREEVRLRNERFEAMRHLVGGLAHEIGNPLAAMKATVEVWSRNLDAFGRSDHTRFLERLAAGIDRMQASVDRIRTWGAQERRENEMVPIAAILEEVHALFHAQAMASGVSLELFPARDPDLRAFGNSGAIYEVCVNIVKNAIEACRAGDRVTIECVADGDTVRASVTDSGAGIREAEMRHLFSPFFTTKPNGTGIGLAQSNHLMEQMGGRIDIQSVEGSGTTAMLRFRRAIGEAPQGVDTGMATRCS